MYSITLVQTYGEYNINVFHVPGYFDTLEEAVELGAEFELSKLSWHPNKVQWTLYDDNRMMLKHGEIKF